MPELVIVAIEVLEIYQQHRNLEATGELDAESVQPRGSTRASWPWRRSWKRPGFGPVLAGIVIVLKCNGCCCCCCCCNSLRLEVGKYQPRPTVAAGNGLRNRVASSQKPVAVASRRSSGCASGSSNRKDTSNSTSRCGGGNRICHLTSNRGCNGDGHCVGE